MSERVDRRRLKLTRQHEGRSGMAAQISRDCLKPLAGHLQDRLRGCGADIDIECGRERECERLDRGGWKRQAMIGRGAKE